MDTLILLPIVSYENIDDMLEDWDSNLLFCRVGGTGLYVDKEAVKKKYGDCKIIFVYFTDDGIDEVVI